MAPSSPGFWLGRWRPKPDFFYGETGDTLEAFLGNDEREEKSAGLRVFSPTAETTDLVDQGLKCPRCGCEFPERPSPGSVQRLMRECGPFPAVAMGKPPSVVATLIADGQCPICASPVTPEWNARTRDESYYVGMPTREDRTLRKSSHVTIGDGRKARGQRRVRRS